MRVPRRVRTGWSAALTIAACALATGCGAGGKAPKHEAPPPPPPPAAYPISRAGGTPATGPGERKNGCERIWCPFHGENFFVDHFVRDHEGFVVHDEERGDLFVPRGGLTVAGVSRWRQSALRLCGQHVHPWVLGKREGTPVRHTGFDRTLGYDRAHYKVYGTRLHPCCLSGMGSEFVHSNLGQRFPFEQLAKYRKQPELGWQRPFAARASKPS